ncbi:MAG: OB-fold domain-containing protein [Pseudomonadota bacterium]
MTDISEPIRLPALEPHTYAFWTSGSRGALEICQCRDCARYIHPPQPMCPHCRSDAVIAQAVSGRGHVASYSVNYQPWVPGQVVPFVFAMVALVEQRGLVLMTRLVHCAVEQVYIGMSVRVFFEQHEDVWLPLFEPEAA